MTARLISGLMVIVMTNTMGNDAARSSTPEGGAGERPAIVLVVFGTSAPEAKKVYEHIDATARRRYPEHDIRWALTSQFILAKLKRQGEDVKSLKEVVAELKLEGRRSAVFQSFHIAPGQEYQEIEDVDTSGLRIAVGAALLADDDDIKSVIELLAEEIAPGVPNVVAFHGNQRYPKFNRQLLAFAGKIEAAHANVMVCSMLGQPGKGKLSRAREEAARSGRVHFIPALVVAGVHVMNDVLGEEADSWKKVGGAKTTTCAKPLGSDDAVLDIYFEHLDEALAKLNRKAQAEKK